MIDYSYASIAHVVVHRVGNPVNEEELILSEKALEFADENAINGAKEYFLSSFRNPESYGLDRQGNEFGEHPLYNVISEVFENQEGFHAASKEIAEALYRSTEHANIKSGDLYVVYFNNISVDGREASAIGLLKSETTETFLHLEEENSEFELSAENGLALGKLDKGCLIFNLDENQGFVVSIVDRSARGGEAQFWRDSFLRLKSKSDDFHHTRNFLSMTKSFVTDQVGEEFEVSKTDKIDMLNRSIEYFKENEHFDQEEFGQVVFGDEEVMHSFQDFGREYQQSNEVDIEMDFAISAPAVKKQSRVFKSVLKLDKNFHVYIHGNKELIERGVEDDGRKFYKIYYENEN